MPVENTAKVYQASYVFFDLDDSLINKDASSLWIKWRVRFDRWAIVEAMQALASLYRAYKKGKVSHWRLSTYYRTRTKGMSIDEYQQHINDFFAQRGHLYIYPQAASLLFAYRRQGAKLILITGQDEENFKILTNGEHIDSFLKHLIENPTEDSAQKALQLSGLWKFLDELKSPKRITLYSEHEDSLIATDRGYGYGKKPEDYLESFKSFVLENQNKMAALNIICTKPKELDRKSLKELRLALDMAGFNSAALNTAWKQTKNEDITADIISYIRTLALGNSLISHEVRIKNAVDKIRKLKSWSKIQEKWINRIETQLIKETVLQIEDLDTSPFKADGGFNRLNKIFDNKLSEYIEIINENLYQGIA